MTILIASSLMNAVIQNLAAGDIWGAVIALYSYSMGQYIFVFIIGVPSLAVYQRMGAVPVLTAWVLFWGALNVAVPPAAINFGVIALIVSLGGLLAVLFFSRRARSVA